MDRVVLVPGLELGQSAASATSSNEVPEATSRTNSRLELHQIALVRRDQLRRGRRGRAMAGHHRRRMQRFAAHSSALCQPARSLSWMSGMRRASSKPPAYSTRAAPIEDGDVAGPAGVAEVQHLHGSADQIELMRGIELLVGLVQVRCRASARRQRVWRSVLRQVSQREAIRRAVRLCMRIGMPRSRNAAPPNKNSGCVCVMRATRTGWSVTLANRRQQRLPVGMRGPGVDGDHAGLADDEAGIADAAEVVSRRLSHRCPPPCRRRALFRSQGAPAWAAPSHRPRGEAAATLHPISARRRVMPGKGYLGPMKQALATRTCNSR